MRDYTPTPPPIDDSTDLLRCITSDALATDPALARSATALERKRQDSERRRRKAIDDALRTTVPLQYRVDYDWKERGAKAPPVYSCLLTTSGRAPQTEWLNHLLTKADCEGAGDNYRREWKLKTPEGPFKFTYSGTSVPPEDPPELMKRMAGAQLVAPERFACRVANVFASGKHRFVVCSTELQPPPMLRVSGALALLHAGDVVSVPLAGAKRDPNGVLMKLDVSRGSETVNTWIVDADAASVIVESAARCPSTEEILAATK